MDRTLTLARVAQAERHIAIGERTLAKQRAIIETLGRDGHDTTDASARLRGFEQTHAIHIGDRNRLRAELERDT
jgi:hypothetical protein